MDVVPHPETLHTLIALAVTSLASVIRSASFALGRYLERPLPYLVALAGGTLLGTAGTHLLPEAMDRLGSRKTGLLFLAGLLGSFLLDQVRLATTIAVLLHEVPYHIADVSVLIYAGLRRSRAILLNLLATTGCATGGVLILISGLRSISISGVTTGTLVGAATLSSLLLRENITALIVLWLLNLGEYLEILTLRRTRRAIRQLLSTEDDEVWLLRDDLEISVRFSTVQTEDVILVRAGRRIAVDGVVESGQGFVNEAPITGESMPAARSIGDSVYAGTILVSGSLRIRVTGVGADTVVGQLIQRVEEAQTLRPKIQTVGDAFARRVVPSSFAAALLAFLITRDPRRALTMMLVACPCTAGLATPTAISASIGDGARRGILIKGGTHLEAMAEVDTVCFDKTGTLTESQPTVQQVVTCREGYDETQVLHLAARVERYSQHPLASAVLEKAAQAGVAPTADEGEFEVLSSRGVRSGNEQEEILASNEELLREFGVAVTEDAITESREFAAGVMTTVFVAHEWQLVGLLAIAAAIRPEAKESMERLQRAGVGRILMLTGDAEPVAQAVAHNVGVHEWRSRLLPQDKFDAIRDLRQAGRKVAMVGDGINDAPALALAAVGIAMGTAGSDVAIETADVALAADDLRGVSSLMQLSRQTMSVVRQNYELALGTNSIGLYLAATGSINPIIAAVLHNLSTILVIVNSTRLIGYDSTGQGQRTRYQRGSAPRARECRHTEAAATPVAATAGQTKPNRESFRNKQPNSAETKTLSGEG